LLNERFETYGSKTEMKAPCSGKISRHAPVRQNICFVEGQMFFGQDRLDFVEQALR